MRGAVALLAVLAACGGRTGSERKPITGPAIDRRTAEKDVRGTVREVYGSIRRGKPDNLFSVLDDKLIVFGPRQRDAMATRTEALVALNKVLEPDHSNVRSGSLAVVAAPGGRSAWAADVVEVEGTQLAMTAILSSEDDFFRVTAVSLARMPSMGQLRAGLEKVAVVPPGADAAANVASGARGAVERFERGLLEQQVWGDDLASRSDAIVIGPASGEVTRGKRAIKKLWKHRIDDEVRAAISGEITAKTTADGQLAWVTAPVTRLDKHEHPLPLRVFAVFERAGSGWTMVALHEALALDEPGAGARFVKVVPAAPRPPPELDDDRNDKKAANKQKKTKKKNKKNKKHKRR